MSALVDTSRAEAVEPPVVEVLLDAGRPAMGEYTCADCGYGVSVRSMLPVCPMCRGLTWEPTASTQQGFLPI